MEVKVEEYFDAFGDFPDYNDNRPSGGGSYKDNIPDSEQDETGWQWRRSPKSWHLQLFHKLIQY